MDMRAGGGSWDGASKCNEGNTCFAQLVYERLAFSAIGMECDIHGVAMIESEAIVSF